MKTFPADGAAPRGAQLDATRNLAGHQAEATPYRAKIVSEMADRITDLYDYDKRLCLRLLDVLVRIYQTEPGAFREVLHILAGFLNAGKSLAVIGEEKGCSKQNVHQTQLRHIAKLAERFPLIAKSVGEILGRANRSTKFRPEKESNP